MKKLILSKIAICLSLFGQLNCMNVGPHCNICNISVCVLVGIGSMCVFVPLWRTPYSPYPGRQWVQPGCFSLRCRGYRETDGPPVLPPAFGPSRWARPPPALRSHTPPHRSLGLGCPHPEQAGRYTKEKKINTNEDSFLITDTAF